MKTLSHIRMIDLLNSGLISVGDRFGFRTVDSYRGGEAILLIDGNFEIPGEGTFSSPSSLASHLSGGKSYNGWQVIVRISDGISLDTLRRKILID